MKAVVMTSNGDPEVLQLRDVNEPSIGRDTEVLVRLKAAGVNPVDLKLRRGEAAYPLGEPAVLGCDGAGVVEQVGPGVTGLAVGDEVYFSQPGFGARMGNYAEYVVIDERLVARKPESLSFEEAAAVPLVLITAWEALHDRARVREGHHVLIHGGAGGVGHMAIQLAKLAGARVCTTVSSEKKAAFVERLGADEPVFYKEENFTIALLDWTNEEGVDICLDTAGGETFEHSFTAVRVYGDLVTLLPPPPDTNWMVARQRNLRIGFELMLTPHYLGMVDAQRRQGQILRDASGLIDEGRLRVHVAETFPLEDAAEAHRRLEAGAATGKLVLAID